MAYENIRFSKDHFALVDGYFYMFDNTNNVVECTVADGDTAFSYTSLTTFNQLHQAHYDGFYFWTMEDGPTAGSDLVFRKWLIEGAFITQKGKYSLIGTSGEHRYDSDTFCIEHYNTTFSGTALEGSSSFYVNDIRRMVPGTDLTLGPNSAGLYEEVTVTGTVSGTDNSGLVQMNFYLLHTYEDGDVVTQAENIFLFNNYSNRTSNGALYKFNTSDNNLNYVNHTADDEYLNIKAATFGEFSTNHVGSSISNIFYVKNTNLKMLDPLDLSITTTMVMDNIETDGSPVYTIYAIQVYGNTLYRLQRQAMYYGSNYTFSSSTYNYVMSPLRNYIDTITAGVYPQVLPANGVNIAAISSTVKDQYGNLFAYRPVYYSDDDDHGFVGTSMMMTSTDGVSRNYYRSGLDVRTVTVSIYVSQYD